MNRAGTAARGSSPRAHGARLARASVTPALLVAALALAAALARAQEASPQPAPDAAADSLAALEPVPAAATERAPARAAARAPARPAPAAAPPTSLRDVNEWVAWKEARQLTALPDEARLFYRRGLVARQSGRFQDALADVRGAVELDPTFIEPHVTLADWSLWRDPSQTLVHCAAIVDRLRRDFNVQLDLAANALLFGLEALFAGLLFAGMFVVFLRRNELVHGLQESLTPFVSPASARGWMSLVLLLPFLAGVGLTLPVLAMLAMLWPVLRLRERVLFVLLSVAAVGAPFALATLDRFTLALRADARPFYELPQLENAPWEPARQARLEHLAAQDPGSGFAQFALGWYSRRGGSLEVAERAYRAALAAWPEDDAALTDLGNVVAVGGRADEALKLYARAVAADPQNAAAHFNAAQLLTRRFEYAAASKELGQASALDFELVKQYQSRAGTGGLLPLVDVWPRPRRFWDALRAAELPRGPLPLPLVLRERMEATGWPFSIVALAALSLGLAFGRWQHQQLPLRHCGNCGIVVCRRCARRRRETALCPDCDRAGAGAETQEFSRVLLHKHRSRRRGVARIVHAALGALVPGYGLLAQRRVFGPVLLIAASWLVGRLMFTAVPPFSLTPRLSTPNGGAPGILLFLGCAVLYAWSLGGWLVVAAHDRTRGPRLEAAPRGRATPPARREPPVAA